MLPYDLQLSWNLRGLLTSLFAAGILLALTGGAAAAQKKGAVEVTFPPQLPGGLEHVSVRSDDFLKPTETLREGVKIAKTVPTVDFLYYPGQDYPGNPWSNWGDGVAINGKYYSAIGDHLAIGGKGTHGNGTGRVFEYDPETKQMRLLSDLDKVLHMPRDHYTPGKIHSRIDLGNDGRLYYATHRGSTTVTTDQFHYKGDWILRTNPVTAETEIVAQGPVPKHCIPNSVLDPERLIFYGGTAPGSKDDGGIQFFAYDCRNKKMLYAGPDGPARYMIFAKSTGRVYYVPGAGDGVLMRYDPEAGGAPVELPGSLIGIRAATQETPQGIVYTVSTGQGASDANLWSFNTKTEEIRKLGVTSVGKASYIASLDADPQGKYLYYVHGAHGGSEVDGAPIVQYNVQNGERKVLAFLHPYFQEKYGMVLRGTYSTAVDPAGDKLYVTWNISRGSGAWDSCGLTVIHIPESERQ